MIVTASIPDDVSALSETDFHTLYYRYRELLCSAVMLKTGDYGESLDMVQELFTDLWEQREVLLATGSLVTYMLSSIEDRILHYQQNKDVQEKMWQDYERLSAPSHYASDIAEDKPIRNIAKEVVESAIRELPPRMRYIITEHLYNNKSIHDLSTGMQITPQAVKIQLTKALHRIEAFIRNNLPVAQS